MNKTAITSALVSRLLAAQFPQWAHLPVAPVGLDGWDNTTFRLGDQLSVRLPSADAYVPQIEKEQRWCPCSRPSSHFRSPSPSPNAPPGAASRDPGLSTAGFRASPAQN